MHISRFVLFGSVGFICGVAIGSVYDIFIDVFFVTGILSVIFVFIFYKKIWIWCLVFFMFCFSIGFWVICDNLLEIESKEKYVGDIIVGEAVVTQDVINKNWNSQAILEFAEKVQPRVDSRLDFGENITVFIKDEKYSELEMGSVVNLECKLALAENFNDFDYRMYLAMRGIDYVCSDFEYEVLKTDSGVLGNLAKFRMKMESVVNNIIPAPEAALANGLLFGGDDRLSDEMQDKFAQTGMTHIVAVSGYNVSVIVSVVIGVIIFLGANRRQSVWFAILAILFFVALIGFPSSGVRAGIMGAMILIAASFGRVAHAYGAIFFTGAVMIAFNPLLLFYDVGFQLSFLATLGIVAVYPIMEKYFIGKHKAFGIVEILLLTVSAQIFVLPIIVYHFHTISIVSLLANLLVLPIIPITMFFVFMSVVMSFIFYPLAVIFGWAAYFLLYYEVFIIDILAKVPYSSINVENVSVGWFILYYVLVGSVVYFINKKIAYE
ncbi:MAG: ComEC/Rec2 family competence protein [Patescibacteria group bacterium]